MELPKNITQVGVSDHRCKVYAEDYVNSYMKQMNRQAGNSSVTVALYGTRKEENNISYVFFYGAGKVNSIQKEVRHLSQAQNQEIEKIRRRYFPDYQFMGYRILDGEMVEGFHICDQGVCRYISGYACFYEKNDAMLAYMLDSRKEEAAPESIDQEKFERVKQRQEERRAQYRSSIGYNTNKKEETVREEVPEKRVRASRPSRTVTREKPKVQTSHSLKLMRTAVAGMFLLLSVLGIAAVNDFGKAEDIQAAARQLITEFTEQKIPDAMDETAASNQSDTLVTEDKLTDAIQQENAAQQSAQVTETQPETQQATDQQDAAQQVGEQQVTEQQSAEPPSQESQQSVESGGQVAEATQESAPSEETQPENVQQEEQQETTQQEPAQSQEPSKQASAPVTYTIKRGDTLTEISIRNYGTDAMVKDICELNQIDNPDDIRFGQKILLP